MLFYNTAPTGGGDRGGRDGSAVVLLGSCGMLPKQLSSIQLTPTTRVVSYAAVLCGGVPLFLCLALGAARGAIPTSLRGRAPQPRVIKPPIQLTIEFSVPGRPETRPVFLGSYV